MADRKPTVLNPAGYQENLQDADNLVSVAAPTQDYHAANKEFVDDEVQVVQGEVDALEVRVTNIEGGPAVEDGTITFSGSAGITLTGTSVFSANQATDITLDIVGPDLSGLLSKPSSDGDFIISKSGSSVTYNDVIDCGTYS